MRFVTLLACGLLGIAQPAFAQSTPPAPTIDAAKLSISKAIAERIWPDGMIKRVMSASMDQMMGGMMDKMMDLPIDSLAALIGVEANKLTDLESTTLNDVMAIVDPAFKQRNKLGMDAMLDEITTLMTKMEPEMRAGMAEAYANQFSSTELADIDRFYATPSGAAFATKSVMIQSDPAFVSRMQTMVPKIIDAMPAMVKKAEAATASLPKPRGVSELSQAEKDKLAALLDIQADDIK